jgi:hypothetical protein
MSTTTVLPFAGGELSSFDPQDAGCIESTGSGTFDPAVSRCSISIGGASAGCKSPVWATASELWFHGVCFPAVTSDSPLIQFYDGATVVADVRNSASNVWTVRTLQGGVLTSVGTLALWGGPTGMINTIDLRVVAGASGVAAGFLQGTKIFETAGLDHTGFSGITQVQLMLGGGTGFRVGWSQIICDDVSHVGDKLVTIPEDTASAINADWTGVVSDINEIVLDDSHSVTSASAGQVSTYYKAGASLGTWNVVAICVGARAQLTAGSPTNLQIALRTNGTNYFGPTTGLDFGFAAVCASWTQNPFTAAAWDPVTAAAVESGMKSIA